MATTDPIQALEELNMEVIEKNQSKEIRLAQRILRIKKAVPFKLHKVVSEYIRKKKRDKLNSAISNYVSPEDREYACPNVVTDKSGVVYTCITKGYDDPLEPVLFSPNLEYVLYTDKHNTEKNSVWKLRNITESPPNAHDTFTNRYYKFHPFEFFKEKDFSIYIDGNVKIVSDITGLYTVAHESKIGIAIHKHSSRDCAYLDARWCEINRRGNIGAIQTQMKRYREEGFPEHYGLCENTIIVVDLHNPLAKKVLDTWWEEFITSGSGRDQISLPYVMWKMGLSMDTIGSLGNDEYFNPKFRIDTHSKQKKHGLTSLV